MLSFPITHIIGQKLKTLRMTAGLTDPEICKRLQMTAGDFSKLEGGGVEIPLWRLAEIAAVMDIDILDLLQREEDTEGPELNTIVELFARMNAQQAQEIFRLKRKVIELYNGFDSRSCTL